MTAQPAQRTLDTKRCTRCGTVKPVADYTADRSGGGRDGLKSACKDCAARDTRERKTRLRTQADEAHAVKGVPRPDRCPEGCGRWPTRPESGLCERHHQVAAANTGWSRHVGGEGTP